MLRTRTLVLPVFATVLLLAAAAGCKSTDNTVNTTAAGQSAAGSQTAAPAASGAKKAGLGDTVDITGFNGEKLALTLVKVVDPASGADQFMTADAGKRYYAVQVKIVNTGKAAYSDSPDNCMKVKDGAGQQFQTDLATVTAGPGFGSVNLAAGDTALGYEVFQVPTGDKVTQVEYTIDSGMGTGSAEWTIG